MNVPVIAWRNIWRNKRRSALTALAVAASCALLIFLMALQRGSYAEMIEATVMARTGHIQIQQPEYLKNRDLANRVPDPEGVIRAVADVPHVRAVAPRLDAAALVSSGRRTFGGLIFGVDPQRETGLSRIAKVVTEGRWLAADDPQGAVLGRLLARNLGVSVGGEVVFLGQGADGSTAAGKLTVRGIYDFGVDELDRSTLAVPIQTVQQAFAMEDSVSAVAVLLDSDRNRDAAVRQIEGRLAGRPAPLATRGWPEIMPGVIQAIRMDWNSGLIMYAVLVLIVGFGVANTFLMAFLERMREYGVLLSLGMRPRALAWMAYLESLLLTAIGLAAGLLIGIPAAQWFAVHGITFSSEGHMAAQYGISPVIHAQLSWPVLGWAVGIVAVVSALMAVYPARKAASLKPVEALKAG